MKLRRILIVRLVANASCKSWWVGNNPHTDLIDEAAKAAHRAVARMVNP